MKKTFKKILLFGFALSITLSGSLTSFAGIWKSGTVENQNRWWYATNESGTAWYANGWYWIDGNNDGVSECYYFDPDGYALTNTTTPDGHTVNADGA